MPEACEPACGSRTSSSPPSAPASRRSAPRTCAPTCRGSSPSARLNDWGRSERIEGLLDRTLYDFFYSYWFRAEVEGIENVPAGGGALLVSNHSGALPPDARDDRQGDPRGASRTRVR